MEIRINQTLPGVKQYPHHSHRRYEIMHYIKGNGAMWVEDGELPFSEGTVIIIPPNIYHGSFSQKEFVNISIECDFDGLLLLDSPIVLFCSENDAGTQLVRMIWENRCGNEAYLNSLCMAYIHCLLQKIKIEDEKVSCVKHVAKRIFECAFDPEADVTAILRQSGYSEDYIRMCFRKELGKAPLAFLTELRIKHACYLIDVYKHTLSLSEVAEKCGYLDYIHFSKKFKEYTGVSPRCYRDS